MSNNIFNPNHQETNLSNKIIAGLERISEAFKVLLWQKAKTIGLSPIQIQILIFINYHKIEFCNVSHLAKEFNVTKPTISDAVKVLVNKELIEKVVKAVGDKIVIGCRLSGDDFIKGSNTYKGVYDSLWVDSRLTKEFTQNIV
mgnify:CR=1 FL=1